MKKNKVIIPAMALILFSTAASISGTVAWFTASRVFQTNVGQFSVVETEGNLDVEMIPIAAAGTVAGVSDNTVMVKNASNNAVLTHGSVDETTKTAYIIDPDSPINNPTYLDRGALPDPSPKSWKYQEGITIKDESGVDQLVDVYVAVAWRMDITYTFAGDTAPVGIYLDIDNTKSFITADTPSPADFTFGVAAGQNQDTAKGFRISFMGGSHNLVWGNHAPTDASAIPTWNNTHVEYAENAKVIKDGAIYQAKTTVAANAEWNSANWTPTNEVTLHDAFSTSETYSVGDVVVYNGNTYKAKDAISAGDWDGNKWDAYDCANLSRVQGTAAGSAKCYTSTDYVVSVPSHDRINPDTEYQNTLEASERICVLTNATPGTTNKATIYCAAWYEGTDPNVVTGAAMACLKAQMTLYARTLKTGAKS